MSCPAGLCQCLGPNQDGEVPRVYSRQSGSHQRSCCSFWSAVRRRLRIRCCAEPAAAGNILQASLVCHPRGLRQGHTAGRGRPRLCRFKELGVPVWRGSFGWDDYEPERGNYDFDWLRAFASAGRQHGDLAASLHRIHAGLGRPGRQGRPCVERCAEESGRLGSIRGRARHRSPGRLERALL